MQVDEIECDVDEDLQNEGICVGGGGATDKNIHSSSFVNKLKDFSTFNPSGNKGKEKQNQSLMILKPPVTLASKRGKLNDSDGKIKVQRENSFSK